MQLNNTIRISSAGGGLTDRELADALWSSLPVDFKKLKKVLLIPPDATRAHSGAGKLTGIYYHLLHGTCEVHILPALGTHVPMTVSECAEMFGDIPYACFLEHNWRADIVRIGTAPKEFVRDISEGLLDEPIDFEINKALLDPSYDLIVSIGQVVPHEVVGMANYTKNILVGCGGSRIINTSHMLGALYGLERLMGRDRSPVRKLFDYAEENLLKDLPLSYVLTVASGEGAHTAVRGLFIGRARVIFEQAVALSQKYNITLLDAPLQKVVVYLDPKEFRSTWLGNKAVYRTRMAIADGGELVILAPGIERFGEDGDIDLLIRKYGYRGRDGILACCRENQDLRQNLSAAAHLIHGSPEGRFRIVYCPGHLTKEEIEGVGYGYMPYGEAAGLYLPGNHEEGFNTAPDGGTFYFIGNPAVGLWAERNKLKSD
jgi:nickel-dependent lactate racemase